MDRGFRFLCQADTTRLVSFVGITVAIVLMVQYSELPNSKLLSSLTSRITSFTIDTYSAYSKVEGDNMHLNGSNSNSTHALEDIAVSPQASLSGLDSVVNFSTRDHGSPKGSVQGRENNLISQGAASPQPMVPLPNRTSLDSQTDSISPLVSVTSAATSVKSDSTGPVNKDGNSGSLQGSSNLTSNNGKPLTAKSSKKWPSKVVSLSEMNLLLQHNHASSLLVVCFG